MVGFAVEGLGDGGWAADLADAEDFDFKITGLDADGEAVANAYVAGRLGGVAVGGDAAQVAGLDGERPGFEKARGPEPFIHANRVRGLGWASGIHGRVPFPDDFSVCGRGGERGA